MTKMADLQANQKSQSKAQFQFNDSYDVTTEQSLITNLNNDGISLKQELKTCMEQSQKSENTNPSSQSTPIKHKQKVKFVEKREEASKSDSNEDEDEENESSDSELETKQPDGGKRQARNNRKQGGITMKINNTILPFYIQLCGKTQ